MANIPRSIGPRASVAASLRGLPPVETPADTLFDFALFTRQLYERCQYLAELPAQIAPRALSRRNLKVYDLARWQAQHPVWPGEAMTMESFREGFAAYAAAGVAAYRAVAGAAAKVHGLPSDWTVRTKAIVAQLYNSYGVASQAATAYVDDPVGMMVVDEFVVVVRLRPAETLAAFRTKLEAIEDRVAEFLVAAAPAADVPPRTRGMISHADLLELSGVSSPTLQNAVAGAGVRLNKRGGRNRVYSPQEAENIMRSGADNGGDAHTRNAFNSGLTRLKQRS